AVREVCARWELPCTVIGEVAEGGVLHALCNGETVGEIPASFLTDECPRYEVEQQPHARVAPPRAQGFESKRWIYEQYDHLVGSRTVRRPGLDAAVLRLTPSLRGLAVWLQGGELDGGPFHTGATAVFGAARNVACAGGRPVGLTDCLNFGNPEKPEIAWELAEAIDGIAAAANAIDAPVVSGNVSLYNETDGRSIPPTPVVGCVGLVPDVRRIPDRWRAGDVARITYFGLFALQHRGQESAGIAASDNGRLTVLRDMGLVSQVFDEQNLSGLRGDAAIGHTRYSTTGSTQWANAQPLLHHGRARTVALGHNGNLTNASALRTELADEGVTVSSTSDSELIAALVATAPCGLDEAVAAAMARLEGAYSVTALAEGALLAFRDPFGFRPLVLGRLDGEWVVASETCALDLVGAVFEREVAPGELVVVDDKGLRSMQAVEPAEHGALCIFEFFYLARPDTRLEG